MRDFQLIRVKCSGKYMLQFQDEDQEFKPCKRQLLETLVTTHNNIQDINTIKDPNEKMRKFLNCQHMQSNYFAINQ